MHASLARGHGPSKAALAGATAASAPPADPIPIGSGVVPARSLLISWTSNPREEAPGPALGPSPDTVGIADGVTLLASSLEIPGRGDTDVPASAPLPVPSDDATEAEPGDAEPAAEAPHGADQRGSDEPARVPDLPDPEGSPVASDPPESAASDSDGYDFLFGGTIHRSVVDAVVKDVEAQDLLPSAGGEAPAPAGTASPVAPVAPPPPPPPVAPGPVIKAKSSGMIDSVPWVAGRATPPPDAPAVPPVDARPPTDDLGLPDLSFAFYDRLLVFDNATKTLDVVVLAHVDDGSAEAAERGYAEACRRIDATIERLSRR